MRQQPAVICLVLAGATVLGACSSTTATSQHVGAFAGLLRDVPDSPATRGATVELADLGTIRTWPRAVDAQDEVRRLLDATAHQLRLPDPLGACCFSRPELADLIGFDLRDLDRSVQYGSLPDSRVSIMVGRFNPAAVATALRGGRGGDTMTTTQEQGWTLLSLGAEGSVDIGSVGPLRPIGEAVRVAVRADALVWTRTDAARADALRATAGGVALAADPTVAGIARALDDARTTSATVVLTPWPQAGWDVAGIGQVDTAGSPSVVAALHLPSPAEAGDAVTALRRTIGSGLSLQTRQPWSSLVTITSLAAEGSQVTAILAASGPGLGRRIVEARDTLFDVGRP